jgi:hypothetical protein
MGCRFAAIRPVEASLRSGQRCRAHRLTSGLVDGRCWPGTYGGARRCSGRRSAWAFAGPSLARRRLIGRSPKRWRCHDAGITGRGDRPRPGVLWPPGRPPGAACLRLAHQSNRRLVGGRPARQSASSERRIPFEQLLEDRSAPQAHRPNVLCLQTEFHGDSGNRPRLPVTLLLSRRRSAS